MSETVISFEDLVKHREESQYLKRWTQFYTGQSHELLLEELINEHENDFPLRRSGSVMDRMRHRALVMVLDKRAQTDFLRDFLKEIKVAELSN